MYFLTWLWTRVFENLVQMKNQCNFILFFFDLSRLVVTHCFWARLFIDLERFTCEAHWL